jgi:hypothetical protein
VIAVQEAVSAVLAYINQFDALLPTTGARLEEFEYDDRAGAWLITLSFVEPQIGVVRDLIRTYRIFTVDGTTGVVTAMKLRNPLGRQVTLP